MDEHIYKRHNKYIVILSYGLPREIRKVIDGPISDYIKEVRIEIGDRYEIQFVEIEIDKDHVHFLIQSVPTMVVSKIVQTIKSICTRDIQNTPRSKAGIMGREFLG